MIPYIIGSNGRLGQIIKQKANAIGINPVFSYDIANYSNPGDREYDFSEMVNGAYKNKGVIIDATTPAAFKKNIFEYTNVRNNIVVATTGWYNELDTVKNLVRDSDSQLIYAGNFSLGVMSFYDRVREQARICNKIGGFKVCVEEIHHIHKLDYPSGTANVLEKIIAEEMGIRPDKFLKHHGEYGKDLVLDNPTKTADIITRPLEAEKKEKVENSYPMISHRVGEVFGYHRVVFYDKNQEIVIDHNSKSRSHFADGIFLAADWIRRQPSGVYTMEDCWKDFKNSEKQK
ncbi:MAG: hypothetical protein LBJ18_00795 [Rickettsiales bacterium]|jgi:4-hydroxy-tetrahydrodipicolinate reductase|nr:hypothetical protein [Rickettsiales bacterium]